jgi:type IX secretion system substrate protein
MGKLGLTIMLLGFFYLSHGQNTVPTGGDCEYDGSIVSITPDGTPSFVLNNGQLYSVTVYLNATGYSCVGEINLKLNNFVVGTFTYADRGTYTIPLVKFNLTPGRYGLQFFYSAVVVNNGLIAVDTVTIVGITGVEPVNINKSETGIYPNPANSECTISYFGTLYDKASVAIYDITGRLMHTYKLTGPSTTISIADMPPGMYQCRIDADGMGVVTKKLVVMR